MLVTDSIANLPTKLSRCIPVILKNESNHDITLSPKAVIGEIHAIKSVQSIESSTSDSQTNPDHKPNLSFDFGNSPVPSEWKERIIKRLNSMPEVFAQHELEFGRTDKVKHRINLNDKTPFKHRARPVHPQDIEAVRNHLHQLLDAEIIRESESPFSSPIVVVRKKNGDVRLCIDYRKLNLQTVKDSYALPNLEESFSALTGSKWFSVMDLKSGFYQIEMEEADKHKTAFVCPLGFFEFNRMPQGITNAPSTFQRLMERCIGELNLKQALVFLDDLIVFSSTLEEHEERVLRVLNRLKEYGLKLSPEKCKFFQTSVKYLGHIVSTKGIETDPEKIAALKTWPKPNNLKELRTFLGFCGYYRRFIKGYSKMVKPLNELTAGYPPLRKRISAAGKAKRYHNPKDLIGDRWTPACQAAFDTLIEKLTDAPILGFADPKLPYILHTDASTSGLGAALYQEQQGQKRVIAYASRGLSKCESKYPAHKLEFLALKWAITEKFQDYLYGSSFLVVTDSNPLTYILTSAKLDAMSYRWLAALSTFDFQLQYRAGKQNQDADGLSRRPHSRLPDDALSQKEVERIQQFTKRHLGSEHVTMNENTVKAICDKHIVHLVINNPPAETSPNPTLVVSLAHHPKALPESFEEEDQFGGLPVIAPFAPEDIRERQRADTCICEILRQMETGETVSSSLRKEIPELGLLLREWSKLKILNGILYRKRQEGIQTYHQLVLPETLRPLVLKSLYDDMGHMGVERTLDLVRKRFYWPKMSANVESRIKTCHRCVRRKSLPEKAAPLVNITATRPLELVCMDFLSVEPGSNNIKDILVITDHFTKYAVAVPTPNQKARTVAKCLWDHFFVHYGIPEKLLSDQGPDFESRIIKELCELIGTQKVRTTPYHPRGNPVERFNRTLLNMLGTLENRKKNQWQNYVKPLVHAYNCTKNEVTGFTPYELMFGRQPRLPIDLALGLPINHQPGSHSQYVNNLRSQLQESYRLATESAKKTADRNRTRFDKHVVNSTLKEGDRVLVRNVRLRGKHKLADRWESDVYVVLKQSEGVPVYVVRPETREGPQRTLHRDLLLPCGFLPMTQVEDEANNTKVARRPRTRQYPNSDLSGETDEDDPQSDLEGCYVDGPRNITVETVGTDNISSIVKYLPGKRDSVPSAALTAAGHSPSDVTKAFPNDPVQVYNPNLPDLGERNLPDAEERNLPDPQERNLPDPEERNLPDPEERSLPSPVEDNLPVGQRSDIPEREVNSINCPAQASERALLRHEAVMSPGRALTASSSTAAASKEKVSSD
ncbi:Retrovirus-related Pol polyprotein from transposon 412 [Labeo rohita]|uniref:Gypsy retrotransposon integrase-like protein 1 n=1 Tax=Labeo rohita TaxID=84645 RepID=A0A498MBH3_LABRO|nr:Retrovirus-related Pol polyprotein from transposon 412 [Labeo rohita]